MAVTRFKTLQAKTPSIVASSSDSDILSNNRVTGWSVNFPIGATCQPSKLCADTCYGLKGPITWSASLRKQQRNLEWCKRDTEGFVAQLERECRKKLRRNPQFYVRWNGVGDLFPESVEAVKELNRRMPDLPIWCVSRIPQFALQLLHIPGVWVHFSIDNASMDRYSAVKRDISQARNSFFSYQCAPEEELSDLPLGVKVLFFDGYQIKPANSHWEGEEVTCPLNLQADITGTCSRCRRCFGG